jgi:hypothetical protein
MSGRFGIGVALAALAVVAAGPVWAADRPEAPAPPPRAQASTAARYDARATTNNLCAVTMTNYGFVGNNFNANRAPSFEYPFGTGYEHLIRGGLWVGALTIDDLGDSLYLCTTAAVDGSTAQQAQSATEFTPLDLQIQERSTLSNSEFYNPGAAVSEQDYVSNYTDDAEPLEGVNERHRPLKINVRQETYSWSFSEFANLIILHFVITNTGPPLRNAWVGFYSEFASGPKNAYGIWPPSATGSSLGSWFQKKLVAYEDSLRLFREHYCAGQPVPSGCFFERTPPWAGVKLLGISPDSLSNPAKRVTFASWSYDPASPLRDQDAERYGIMSSGLKQDLSGPEFQPTTGDPVELIACGPFAELDAGDSISVDFALVAGLTIPEIENVARFAQRAFDLDYIVPVPPPSPRLKVVSRDHEVDFYWDRSPEDFVDPTSAAPDGKDFEGYRLYFSEDPQEVNRHRNLVGQFDVASPFPHDTIGFNTSLDSVRINPPVTIDGVTYHYKFTVRSVKNGFKYTGAVTAFDLGDPLIESLESGVTQNKQDAIPSPSPDQAAGRGITVFPNPYRVEARWDQGQLVRDHYLWFTNLPTRCTIRIYTLAGALVFETQFDGRTYQGTNARGVYNPRSLERAPNLSGSSFAWDLITRSSQAAATGLYMYSVEDADSGAQTVGKFLIVKSDREEF